MIAVEMDMENITYRSFLLSKMCLFFSLMTDKKLIASQCMIRKKEHGLFGPQNLLCIFCTKAVSIWQFHKTLWSNEETGDKWSEKWSKKWFLNLILLFLCSQRRCVTVSVSWHLCYMLLTAALSACTPFYQTSLMFLGIQGTILQLTLFTGYCSVLCVSQFFRVSKHSMHISACNMQGWCCARATLLQKERKENKGLDMVFFQRCWASLSCNQ